MRFTQLIQDGASGGLRPLISHPDSPEMMHFNLYVLLTVVFASVLFFGGIARAFDSRPLRIVLATLAVLPFLGTLAVLTTLPIGHE